MEDSIESLPQNSNPVEQRTQELKALLKKYDLTEYLEKFMESGYDSVSWLYSIAQDEKAMETLADTVGFKPGHAIRFQSHLAKDAASSTTEQQLLV